MWYTGPWSRTDGRWGQGRREGAVTKRRKKKIMQPDLNGKAGEPRGATLFGTIPMPRPRLTSNNIGWWFACEGKMRSDAKEVGKSSGGAGCIRRGFYSTWMHINVGKKDLTPLDRGRLMERVGQKGGQPPKGKKFPPNTRKRSTPI